jgi:hypothetical protein
MMAMSKGLQISSFIRFLFFFFTRRRKEKESNSKIRNGFYSQNFQHPLFLFLNFFYGKLLVIAGIFFKNQKRAFIVNMDDLKKKVKGNRVFYLQLSIHYMHSKAKHIFILHLLLIKKRKKEKNRSNNKMGELSVYPNINTIE